MPSKSNKSGHSRGSRGNFGSSRGQGGARSRSESGRSSTRSGSSSAGGRGSAKTTTSHEEIRQWVESHGGHPASVKGTERGGEGAGLLRIDFPGYSGEGKLEPLSWEDFFEKFDESGLAFVYDAKKTSRFCKLVSRESGSRRNPRE